MNKNILILVLLLIVIAGGAYLFMRGGTPEGEEETSGMPVPGEENYDVVSENVTYHDGITGYLATPSGEGQYPAVVLIHEWWGLTDDVRSMAERFASEGYVALAVDLYNGESTSDSARARELTTMVRENTDEAFVNLESALNYLREQPSVDTNSLASVGWCFGGGWAYNMAVNDLDIDASVMYYGQFDQEDDFEHMRASVLGHFGEEDFSIAVDDVQEFQAALETANGMHEVYIYPNVGHGFANHRGGDNLEYSEEAAELAWDRTQEFLQSVFSEE